MLVYDIKTSNINAENASYMKGRKKKKSNIWVIKFRLYLPCFHGKTVFLSQSACRNEKHFFLISKTSHVFMIPIHISMDEWEGKVSFISFFGCSVLISMATRVKSCPDIFPQSHLITLLQWTKFFLWLPSLLFLSLFNFHLHNILD